MSGDAVLVIGFGNPGRRDDGLGPALVAALEQRNLPGVSLDANYQLNIEDATAVAEHPVVIFVDASAVDDAPYCVREVTPRFQESFTSHSITPQMVLGYAHHYFGADTRAYLLGIRGYEFNEFGERLSADARANLERAAAYLEAVLRRGELERLEQDALCE